MPYARGWEFGRIRSLLRERSIEFTQRFGVDISLNLSFFIFIMYIIYIIYKFVQVNYNNNWLDVLKLERLTFLLINIIFSLFKLDY